MNPCRDHGPHNYCQYCEYLYGKDAVLRAAQVNINKRDLFAAMAMQGLCSTLKTNEENFEPWRKPITAVAVSFADALLAELEKTNEKP